MGPLYLPMGAMEQCKAGLVDFQGLDRLLFHGVYEMLSDFIIFYIVCHSVIAI